MAVWNWTLGLVHCLIITVSFWAYFEGVRMFLMVSSLLHDQEGDKAGGDILKRESSEKVPNSKLEAKLQDLIKLICDVRLMEEAVVEMKYDAKKAPLGRIQAFFEIIDVHTDLV